MVSFKKIFKVDFKSVTSGLGLFGDKKKLCEGTALELFKKNEQICEETEDQVKEKTIPCYKQYQSHSVEDSLYTSRKEGIDSLKVIVVGAGISGLSAAHHLIKNGIENIVILEASDRVGGRILTGWMGDTVIEMGPNIIEGGSIANPIYNMANMGGAFNTKVYRSNKIDQVHYLTSDSRIIDNHIIPSLVFKKFMEQASCARKGGLKCSLLDFLSVRIQQELLNFPEQTRFDTEKLFFGMINNMKSTTGAEISELSTQHFRANQKLPGGDVRIPQGFCTLLSQILADIPAHCLKYHKNVSIIEWSRHIEPEVVVKCKDGDVFTGNFVIVAIPLGVLKKNLHSMFKPSLSELKVTAINNMGVGNIGRVYLEYLSPWWIPDELNMRIAWSPRELKEWKSWTKGISTIASVSDSNRVITFTIGGLDAAEMETYSEVEIAIEFTNFIRKFIGDKTIPFPNNIAVSRWSKYSNFLGGTAYVPAGSNVGLVKNLYMPEMNLCGLSSTPTILFAGDAMHDQHFGTIYGARLSGIREAERLIKYVESKKQCKTIASETLLQENIKARVGN